MCAIDKVRAAALVFLLQ